MELKLDKDTEKRLTESVQRFLAEQFEHEVGTLQAGQFLKFVLAELGPAIYAKAIGDAQSYFHEKATDLENVCFVDEGGWWRKGRR